MFYFSDIVGEIRRYLNDDVSPYRYEDTLIYQFVSDGIRDTHRLRSDSRVGSDGLAPFEGLFDYTQSSYMDGYSGIVGWNRRDNSTLYIGMTAPDVATFYLTSADRTADTNSVAMVSGCSTAGTKAVAEANSSGWGGTVEVLSISSSVTTWDVKATENAIPLDDIFREAIVHFAVAKCFDIDAEDQNNAIVGDRHYQQFRAILGV